MARALDDQERDAIVSSLHNDVLALKELVQNRESELVKLHREIHKLKVRDRETGRERKIRKDYLSFKERTKLIKRHCTTCCKSIQIVVPDVFIR